MGRTPPHQTAVCVAATTGRSCYSIVLAERRHSRRRNPRLRRIASAACPSTNPVSPPTWPPTIFHLLGIDPRAHIADQQGRPLVVSSGTPIQALLP